MSDLSLVIFDVDGTLVDSQAHILMAMEHAFAQAGLACPPRDAVLSIVGLSLPEAFAQLAPDAKNREALIDGYKNAFATLRHRMKDHSPLYPGIRDLLEKLHAKDTLLLGVATGKSRRGLRAVTSHHGLERFFVTQQCADDHPSKPHPSMVMTALAETGVAPQNAVMIGDTSFDIDMGRAAGVATIGVTWGYHPPQALQQATQVVAHVSALDTAIHQVLGTKP